MVIETLERAIVRLEELSRGAKEQGYLGIGEYQPWGGQNQNGDYAESILFDKRGETLVYGLPDGAGHLIVALSRAVDPIVEMLKRNVISMQAAVDAGMDPEKVAWVAEKAGDMALARAILGEEL